MALRDPLVSLLFHLSQDTVQSFSENELRVDGGGRRINGEEPGC